MSDEGEKTCPLCADEMDLTDQQLKPCKCGYEICIWCFHQIIDMAEKDETAGRCPACRTPYNKEKIVGTEANCGRLVSEVNVEKKLKLQKGKSKSVEGRKQLGSVRVIQRNLVYVVGLPLDFADEDLLQEREYFSQYGKVLKVSISRTSAGAIQQIANSACSVYITYSKEEEAIRCIQSVHGFVLDGRPLKACFGTTKYCHAWLRNVPCSNPDCLYLHEVGSEDASFTKDSTISAYTRNRVQHIIGSSNNIQRRSGNVLPAPEDAYCDDSSASSEKPLPKSATNTNNFLISARVSPPSSSSGRSAALPAGAAWGNRPSNSQPLPINTPSSNGPLKQKTDSCNSPVVLSTAVATPSQKSVPNEEATVSQDKNKMETLRPIKEESNRDRRIAVSESSFPSVQLAALPIKRQSHIQPLTEPPSNTIHKVDSSFTSNEPASEKDSLDTREGNMENICSKISSMSTHEKQQLQNGHIEYISEPLTLPKSIKASNTTKEVPVKGVQSDFRLGVLTEVKPVELHDIEDDLLFFDNQRIKDPEIGTDRISDFSRAFHMSQQSFSSSSLNNASSLTNLNLDRHVVDRNSNSVVSTSNFPGGYPENMFNSPMVTGGEYSKPFPSKGSLNVGESSIISNILSIDFDPWNESLTSPQNLAKLLGETNKQQGSFGVPGLRKTQNNNQSRFSFAREQESISQLSNYGHPVDHVQQSSMQQFGHDFSSGTNLHPEKFISRNGFSIPNGTESDFFAGSHSRISSIKNSGSRSQISAPPGFSVPSRAAPPGFTTHERTEQIFDTHSANNMLDASSFLKNQYQTPSSGNTYSNDDIEFIDPAILEVGKGIFAGGVNNSGLLDIRSSYNNSPQASAYEDARFQSLLQRSLPQHQSQRFAHNNGDMFSPPNNGYGIHSRVMEHHALANNPFPYSQFNVPQSRNGITSNGQWDGWNKIQGGNNMGISELLRSDRLGFNKFGGYEDSKLRMPGSGNLYNGSYGIEFQLDP